MLRVRSVRLGQLGAREDRGFEPGLRVLTLASQPSARLQKFGHVGSATILKNTECPLFCTVSEKAWVTITVTVFFEAPLIPLVCTLDLFRFGDRQEIGFQSEISCRCVV